MTCLMDMSMASSKMFGSLKMVDVSPLRCVDLKGEGVDLAGRGAYGTVVKILRDNTIVALKMIKLEADTILPNGTVQKITGTVDLFEIDTLSRLNHPYLIQALEVITPSSCTVERDFIGIVMPFVDGNLHKLNFKLRSENEGVFPFDVFKEITAQMVCGFSFLHDQGVIHCDIKPENILIKTLDVPGDVMGRFQSLKEHYHVYISDFGISDWMPRPYTQVELYQPKYTIWYRPPEFFISQLPYILTKSADVWAFGATLVELLKGLPAFSGKANSRSPVDQLNRETRNAIAKFLTNPTEQIDSWINDVPMEDRQSLRDFLSTCLSRKPSTAGTCPCRGTFGTLKESPLLMGTSVCQSGTVKFSPVPTEINRSPEVLKGALILIKAVSSSFSGRTSLYDKPAYVLFLIMDLYWRIVSLPTIDWNKPGIIQLVVETAVFVGVKSSTLFPLLNAYRFIQQDHKDDVLLIEEAILRANNGIMINPTPFDDAINRSQLLATGPWLLRYEPVILPPAPENLASLKLTMYDPRLCPGTLFDLLKILEDLNGFLAVITNLSTFIE